VESGEVAPQTFTIKTIADRIEHAGDLWADMRTRHYSLRTRAKRIDAEASTRRSS
jgi:DNA primase